MTKDLNVFDKHYGLLINGEWTNGSEGNTLTAYNPANGEALATFIDATDADVDALKAGKEKLMEAAQAVFTKMYEQQAQANGGAAGAGPDMGNMGGAAGAGAGNASDDVVDGDYREI